MRSNKVCRRVTIRLYNHEIISIIDEIPKGLRSAVIQSAIAAYMESGNRRTFVNNLCSAGGLMGKKPAPSRGKGDVFTQLVGDF